MATAISRNEQSTPQAFAFYRRALATLLDADVPFLLGGGYAFYARTTIARMTKDLDIFVLPRDVGRTLEVLAAAGYSTELTYSHWLAKAYSGKEFMDVIFNSGNGCCPVDEQWFDHATTVEVARLPVRLCPPEESIWQKAFILERNRCDVADVAHLLRACGASLDWNRLVQRFAGHWRLLLAHLVLFGYIFPDQRSVIPDWVMQELTARLRADPASSPQASRVCHGTLLSRSQYDVALARWGYEDARLQPWGSMEPDEVTHWSTATD